MAFTSSKMAKLLPRNRMEVTSHHFDLHTSLSSLPVEARESAAQDGVRLLQQLKPALRRVPDAIDPSTWVAQIDKAITQFQGQRSLVGIVGGTGAGKTSFINALLDEETLLPTNCMRACTATITEIAYNTGPSKYRAVIEFLSRDDWEDELIKGFQVLFDANGKLVKDSTNEDSEAGVFYSKIRAIYTELTRDALERSSINGLLNHLGVSVLGRTEDFSSDDAPQFAHRLQTIVDSKDKHAKGPRKEVAYWPIIKRVRLYVRAKALSTGVTLVDLPGIQDSTPARAKIAETYMKTCSGLIVTAPIHRAADDRVAKNLLGPKFRRQVILDGGYSTMTFACTKIDEINIREMSNVAELRPELKRMNAYIDEKRQEQASTEQQLAQKQPELAQAEKRLVETSAKYDIYEDITREGRGLLSNSSLTNSPHPGQKRRLPDGGPAPDGKRQAMDSGGEIVGGDQDDRQAQPDVHTNDSTDYAVTQEAQDEYQKLDQQFAEIQNLREQAKQEKDELAADVVQLRARLDEIQYAISRLEDQKRANCIRHRNRYVIQAIKSDFIAGVRESDEERSGLDDNWDPATETRDYDKLANELPVLTVSARAYQKKMGRANDEQEPAGFTTLEDTGIPAALRHCEQLTLAGRRKNADYFLASMSKLLNTLNLWLANQVDSCKVSDMQREQARLLLQDKLSELKNTFNKLIRSTVEDIGQHLRKAIYKHLDTARKTSATRAATTAQNWCSVTHGTWKAVCRRDGTFINDLGSYDWNDELTGPLLDAIAPHWEAAFGPPLEALLAHFKLRARKRIKEFHASIPELLQPLGLQTKAPLRRLEGQVMGYKQLLNEAEDLAIGFLATEQRDTNRAFKPLIAKAMMPAYTFCVQAAGPGCFRRMQLHMIQFIKERGPDIFRDATRSVQKQLEAMCAGVKDLLNNEVGKVQREIGADYVETLCGERAWGDEDEDTKTDATDVFVNQMAFFLEQCRRSFEDHEHGRKRRDSSTGSNGPVFSMPAFQAPLSPPPTTSRSEYRSGPHSEISPDAEAPSGRFGSVNEFERPKVRKQRHTPSRKSRDATFFAGAFGAAASPLAPTPAPSHTSRHSLHSTANDEATRSLAPHLLNNEDTYVSDEGAESEAEAEAGGGGHFTGGKFSRNAFTPAPRRRVAKLPPRKKSAREALGALGERQRVRYAALSRQEDTSANEVAGDGEGERLGGDQEGLGSGERERGSEGVGQTGVVQQAEVDAFPTEVRDSQEDEEGEIEAARVKQEPSDLFVGGFGGGFAGVAQSVEGDRDGGEDDGDGDDGDGARPRTFGGFIVD